MDAGAGNHRMTYPTEAGSACVMNIGVRERRKRMKFGVTLVAASGLVATVLVATGADRWWRLALFLPFWAGALGVFQAREKT